MFNTKIKKREKIKTIEGVKNHPNDKLLCALCDVYYTRCNAAHHRNTRAHKRLQERDYLIKNILEGENEKPKILTVNKLKQYNAIERIKNKENKIY